ncbi:LysR family transcriptional regulator [Spiribacter halobius]|nr:LysR family transcriptional regulator [Spiribacter halobius]UEX77718.1 LysR family transcriptional regulator [Spiribacter halobius]
MPQVRSDWLETFLAAVETRSFTAAARRVHRSQSAVSLQIGKLEAAVGHRLLVRGPGGLRPTAAGERLLPYVRHAADAVEAVTHALTADTPRLLRLGLPDEYADGTLTDVLARFTRAHPQTSLEVTCGRSALLEPLVLAGELDLALVLADEVRTAGEQLAEDPTLWLQSAAPEGPPDEGTLPIAVFDQECSWRRWALEALESHGIDYRIVFSSGSAAAIRAAIRSGVAVGLLGASSATRDLRPFSGSASMALMPTTRLILLRADRTAAEPAATLGRLLSSALNAAAAAWDPSAHATAPVGTP